jgi:hypothetical protein
MSTVPEKQFLTEEENNTLVEIRTNTRALITEFGEIELAKIQLEERYTNAKKFLAELSQNEQQFTQDLISQYGKVNIDFETGEITPL